MMYLFDYAYIAAITFNIYSCAYEQMNEVREHFDHTGFDWWRQPFADDFAHPACERPLAVSDGWRN